MDEEAHSTQDFALPIETAFLHGRGFGIAQTSPLGPKTAVLLNNTAAHHNHGHLGTIAVSNVIFSELQRRGISTIAYANNLRGVAVLCDHLPALPDLVVLNGEGTLHDNHERAIGLMLAATHFNRFGVPCALINSIWDRNTALMGSYLELFQYIAVRDSLSKLSMSKFTSRNINVVPDISLANTVQAYPPEGVALPIGVVDSSDDKDSKTLRVFSEFLNAPFYLMDGARRGRDPFGTGEVVQVNTIADCSAWITGRYHFALAALATNRPFLAVRTRVSKMQGMMQDAGLSEFLLNDEWLVSALDNKRRAVQDKLAFWNESAFQRSEEYKSRARTSITAAFDTVADLTTAKKTVRR